MRTICLLTVAAVIGLSTAPTVAGTWTCASEPDLSPSNPIWGFTGDLWDREFVANEYLRITTMSAEADPYCVFDAVDGVLVGDWSTEMKAVEFRVKVNEVAGSADGASSLSVYSPTGGGKCSLYSMRLDLGRVGLKDQSQNFNWVSVDTSGWHDYTLVVNPDGNAGAGEALLYQDGNFLVRRQPQGNVGIDYNGIRWGDTGSTVEKGSSDWYSIAWGADATVPQAPLQADLSGDGFVGGADLDIVRANWGKSISSPTPPGFTYENSWDASAMPEASTPAFEFRGDTAYNELITTGDDAPYLNINTPATFGDKNAPGCYNDFTLSNDPAIDMSAGGTIDFTMRVNGQSDPPDDNDAVNAFIIYAPNGSGGCYLYVAWAEADAIAGYDLDTSQWHDYRVLLGSPGETAMLFVDGDYATSITGSLIGSLDYNGIRFGDVSDNRSGDADWKFIGWTSEVLSTEAPTGDINGDGIVDESDLAVLSGEWGQSEILASAAVPEPSTLLLIAVGLGVVFLLKRRK